VSKLFRYLFLLVCCGFCLIAFIGILIPRTYATSTTQSGLAQNENKEILSPIVGSPSPILSPTPSPTQPPSPSPTPTPSPTQPPSPTPTPSPTQPPSPTPTPTATPTTAPTATPTQATGTGSNTNNGGPNTGLLLAMGGLGVILIVVGIIMFVHYSRPV
jgi:outer membrane biosynthesis protein TonB